MSTPVGVGRRRPRGRLRGAVVVLVGASSGVGRATALAFAEHGARLVLAARSDQALDDIARACRARGAVALVVPTEVADAAAVDALAEVAMERFGHIDVWVHGASTLIAGALEATPPEEARRLMDVNVTGFINGARTALRTFRAQQQGVLIVVSSLLSLLPHPTLPVYVASKFANRGLAMSLHHAVADEPHVRVCVVLPGSVDTPMFQRAANHTGRRLRAIPVAYAPERVAAVIVARARRPRRQSTVGLGNRVLLVGHRLAPRLTEWGAARWSARFVVEDLSVPDDTGTLFSAGGGDPAHGGHRRGRLRSRAGEMFGRWRARRGMGTDGRHALGG